VLGRGGREAARRPQRRGAPPALPGRARGLGRERPHPRRADQPPRHRIPRSARGRAPRLPRLHPARLPRPGAARRRGLADRRRRDAPLHRPPTPRGPGAPKLAAVAISAFRPAGGVPAAPAPLRVALGLDLRDHAWPTQPLLAALEGAGYAWLQVQAPPPEV